MTLVRFVQPENAAEPMLMTLAGNVIDEILVPLKAFSPIVVSVAGNVKLV